MQANRWLAIGERSKSDIFKREHQACVYHLVSRFKGILEFKYVQIGISLTFRKYLSHS